MKILWFVLDFMSALADQSDETVELVTTQIFLELMDCDAVGNLKRLTQSSPDGGDITQWAPGIMKIEVYLPRLEKVIALLKTRLQAPVTLYIDVQGVQKPVSVDLAQNAEIATAELLKTVGHWLGQTL